MLLFLLILVLVSTGILATCTTGIGFFRCYKQYKKKLPKHSSVWSHSPLTKSDVTKKCLFGYLGLIVGIGGLVLLSIKLIDALQMCHEDLMISLLVVLFDFLIFFGIGMSIGFKKCEKEVKNACERLNIKCPQL